MRSVFFDFHLPNATTWFYVSAIVTVSLFFRFNRPFSLRNLDLFLLSNLTIVMYVITIYVILLIIIQKY